MNHFHFVRNTLPILDQDQYPKLPLLLKGSFLVLPEEVVISGHKRSADIRWVIGIWTTACVRAGLWQPIAKSTFEDLVREAFTTEHPELVELSPDLLINKVTQLTSVTWSGWMKFWRQIARVGAENYLVLSPITLRWLEQKGWEIQQTFPTYSTGY
jgi:hypothetical protein